jgi:hypothetical protein
MKKISYILLVVILGVLLGTVVGEILAQIIRSQTFHSFFAAGVDLGLDPPMTFDVRALALTIGFKVRLNLTGLAGGLSALLLYFRLR